MTQQIHVPPPLFAEIGAQCERTVMGGDLSALINHIKHSFGDSLSGILLYGSCLYSHNFNDGVVDLYVIVSSYNAAYQNKLLRLLNALLPPNVFYFETGEGENKVRAKYAVISIDDFQHGVENWFHSYIWSRFAQPARLIYCCDGEIRLRIYYMLAHSVIVFLKRTISCLGSGRFDTEAIWSNGLRLTYAAELRPEQQSRAEYITHQSMGDFIRLTQFASPMLSGLLEELPRGYYQITTTSKDKVRCIWQWRIRRWQGRMLSILRLMKAVFTFKNCVDYAAWKIKRHTGISIEVTPILQKHPILFGFNILWRLLRRDALR
jgi:hypothetical protein